MTKKYFVDFNGYYVKDLELHEEVQYIFPKFFNSGHSGDISIIKYRDKNIVIDTHSSTNWNDVKNMLDDNDVSHIDYLIITHYHTDHIGNFYNMYNNGYIDSDTIFYMPSEVTSFGDTINNLIIEYQNYFQTNNLRYHVPFENEVLTIDNLKIKFYNCDNTILDTTYTDYNNTSTICIFEYGNNMALFMGDCGKDSYTRLKNSNLITKNVDLFKVGHHGINMPTDKDFINKINPKYSVIIGGILDFSSGNLSLSSEVSILKNLNSCILCSFINTDYIKLSSNFNVTKCIKGIPFETSNYNTGYDIYCDNSINDTDYQDGSQTYPFKEILQALGSINYNISSVVHIHLADGEYSSAFSTIIGGKNSAQIHDTKNVTVDIIGNSTNNDNVVIDTCYLLNANVKFSYLTIKGNNATALEARNSLISLDNVKIISNETGTKYDGIILRENSLLTGSNITFNNLARGLILRTGSNINLNTVTFTTLTGVVIDKDNECLSLLQNITFTNESLLLPFKLAQRVHVDDDVVYNGTPTQAGITLKRQTNYYNWIKIDYQDNDGVKSTTGKIQTGSNNTQIIYIPATIQKLSNSNIIISQCTFKIQGQYVSFQDHRETTITSAGTISISSDSRYISITKITCGYDYELSKI